MTPVKLQQLIGQKEGLKLDFKREYHLNKVAPCGVTKQYWVKFVNGQWDEFIKDILAICNGNCGTAHLYGYLVIGVDDKLLSDNTRHLHDCHNLNISAQQILNKVNRACHPPIPNLDCEFVILDGKRICVITIPPSPYVHETSRQLVTTKGEFNKNGQLKHVKDGRIYTERTVFIRRGEDIHPATSEERLRLEREKANVTTVPEEGEVSFSQARMHLWLEYLQQLISQQALNLHTENIYLQRTVSLVQDEILSLFDYPLSTTHEFEQRNQPTKSKHSLDLVLQSNSKIVLLGEPGAGKSASLRRLANTNAKRIMNNYADTDKLIFDQHQLFPIFAELRAYRGQPLAEWLFEQVKLGVRRRNVKIAANEDSSSIMSILKNGNCLLLLDGLNEVASEYKQALLNELQIWFQNPISIVLSCRFRDYQDYFSGLCIVVKINELSKEDIQGYLINTLGNKTGREVFDERIKTDNELVSLASNPFMLQIIAIIVLQDLPGRVPANRGLLMRRFVDLIPRLRRRDGVADIVPHHVFLDELRSLAFHMKWNGNINPTLNEVINWDRQRPHSQYKFSDILIQAKNWRLLKSDGRLGESLEFIHELFVEYFAADAWREGLQRHGHGFNSWPGRAIWRDEWGETVTMFAGIHDDSATFLLWFAKELLADRNAFLDIHRRKLRDSAIVLYECWRSTLTEESIKFRNLIVDALMISMHSPNPFSQADVALVEIGGSEVMNLVLNDLIDPPQLTDVLYAMRALSILKKIGDDSTVGHLLDFYSTCCDEECIERGMTIEAIQAILDRSEFDALLLMTFTEALHHKHPKVRSIACSLFGNIENPHDIRTIGSIVDMLSNIAENDQAETPWGKVSDHANDAQNKIIQRLDKIKTVIDS